MTFDYTVANGLSAVFDPASPGTTTLTVLAPPGFSQPSSQASLVATVTPPSLTILPRSIGKNLQAPLSVNLGSPAPAGNLEVTITSADPSKVLLSASGGAGSPSITVTVPAGQTSSAAFYVQALTDTGTSDVTASAPGFASGTTAMSLYPSGFVIAHIYWCLWCGGQEIQTTAGAANTGFYLVAMKLNPVTLNPEEGQNVRGGLTVDVTVSTTPTGVGTIVPTPITVTGGTAFEAGVSSIAFDPAAAGTTLLEVVTPPGFSPSSAHRTMTATVTNAALSMTAQTIGKNLQVAVTVALGEPAPAGGLDVTVTSADPSKLLVSGSGDVQGVASAVVHAPAGQTSVTVYAQALSDAGSVGLTATAPGRTTSVETMTLTPGGFILTHLYWCVSCVPQTIDTTTGAANTQLYVVAGRLDAGTGNFVVSQNVRGGLSVDVTVSSTATVGTNVMALVPPTVSFTGGTAFGSSVVGIEADPLSAGTAILAVVTPTGFAASNTFREITATVAGPALQLADVAIGRDLQSSFNVNLQEPAPVGGLDITLTSGDAAKMVISADATLGGAVSGTVHVPQGSQSATFYVQALVGSGTASLTATAPAFSQGVANATFQPSGFVIGQLNWCLHCFGPSFNTTTGSPNTALDVVAARLTPGTHAYEVAQPVRGGITVNVTVQSTDSSGTNVGTMTPPSVSFTGNVAVASTAFDPQNAGTAVIEPVPPAGFVSPSTFRNLTANVAAPGITLNVNTVGKDLQTTASGSLAAPAPAGGLSVTITSSDANRLTLGLTPTDPGSLSVTFEVAEGSSSLPAFYLQGRDGSGSVDITANATGYTPGTASVPLASSGFVMLSPGTNFTTTTLAAPTTLGVYSAVLSPTLTYLTTQPVRPGASVAVTVTAVDSTGTGVGTITGSPVTFNGNEGVHQVFYDPASPGSSIITVVPPAGFSTPSNYRVFTVTVNAPSMFVGDAFLGKDLQTAMSGSLGDTSPADVTFTITSTNPARVLVSALPNTAGATSIMVTSPGPTNVIPAFYVQGLTDSGSATLTISAPNFLPTTAQVFLTPSGFIISSPSNFTTQGNSVNTAFQIASARLAPGSLTYQVGQPLRPGASASVNVTSTAPSVGAITLSPVVFSGNQGVQSTFFDPQPVAVDGTTTVQLSTPAGYATPSQYQSVDVTVQAVVIDPTATSNYAQWLLGAAASPDVVSFDELGSGVVLAGTEYAVRGLTITQRDGHTKRIAEAGGFPQVLPGNLNSGTKGVSSSFDLAGYSDAASENYDFVFSHAVTSAGLWIGNLDPGAPAVVVQFLDTAGAVIQSYDASALDANVVSGGGDPKNNRVFVGINAAATIGRIRVLQPAGDGDGVVFDDIVFNRAATTVLDFEDQPDSFVKVAFPASYRGVTWTNFLHYAPYPAQYQPGGVNAIFGAVDGARFTFPEQVFVGADFRRSPGTTGAIYFELYRQGTLVHTSATFGTGTALAFLPSGYGGPVDEVRVRSLGDTMVALGAMWVMDNVSFIQTTLAGPLFLTPASQSQAVGSTEPMTVSILNPLSFDLAVALTSSDSPVASVPASVVIPAGATSAAFDVTAGAGAGGALITATSPDASPARAVVAVGSNVVEWISNTSGVWSQGANWSTGAPPGAADVVRIDRPGNITVFVDTVGAARTLLASETVTVASALTIASAAAFDRGLNLQAALQGAGRASVRGMSTWASGTVALGGGLDIEAGQTLTITLANEHRVQSSELRNRGTVVFSDGIVTATLNGTVLNEAGGLWLVQGNRQIASDFAGGSNSFINAGTLRRTSGTGVLTLGGGLITFGNTGTMDIQTGTVNAAVALTTSGHLSVAAGAEFPLSNVHLQAGSSFSGGGLLKLNGATTVSGALTVPVAVEMTGNVTGAGSMTMTAPMTWISGVLSLGGGLDVQAGQTLTIIGANEHRVTQGALRNRGTVMLSNGTVTASLNASILNDVGALWVAQGDRQIASDFAGGANTFTNAGLFQRTSGTGPLTFGGGLITFSNTGTIEIQTGTVNFAVPFANSGHLSVAPGAELPLANVTLQAGTTISGAGLLKFNGSTNVATNLSVAVPVEMTGNVEGTGQITMTAPMTWISGALALGGGLDIEAGQTLTMTGANDHPVRMSALRNRGTVMLSNGTVTASLNASILNDVGALWVAQGDRQIASDFAGGTNTFTNAGLFQRTSGAGVLTFGGGLIGLVNTGTMDIQTGTVNAAVAFTNSGHLNVAAGAELPLSNFTLESGTTFSGGGLLKLNGTTTVNGPLTVPLALEMTGNVSGPGHITMMAPMTWISGALMLGGGLDIEAGQTLTMTGANDHPVRTSALRNRGTVMLSNGTVTASLNASILNDVGALWVAQGDRQIGSDFAGGTNTFTNAGLFQRTSGAGVLTFGGGLIGLVNTGTMDIQTGTVNAAVAFTNSGHLNVAAGAELPLSNFTLESGSTFSGGGLLKLNGVTTVNGTLTIPVALEMTGNVSGPGRITMTATMNWRSGAVMLGGGLDIEAGRILNILDASDHRVQSSALRNRGNVVWGSGTISAILNGVILNDVGGIWDAQGSRQIASDFSGGTNSFTNAGELRNTAPSGTLTIGGGVIAFINTGTIVQRIFNASDYDRISVTGQFTMGGTLDVRLASGFVPAVTDVLTLQTFGSRVGTFTTINGNGHTWVPCYGATSLLLGDPANGAFCAGP